MEFAFAALVESLPCGDHDFANDVKRFDEFRIVEAGFDLPHDEPRGSPRFVVRQVDRSRAGFTLRDQP